MYAKHLPVHNGRERQVVENLATPTPNVRRAILPLAFVEETVDLCDLARFVVAADERDPLRVSHLEREEEQESLNAVESTIHKVT